MRFAILMIFIIWGAILSIGAYEQTKREKPTKCECICNGQKQ